MKPAIARGRRGRPTRVLRPATAALLTLLASPLAIGVSAQTSSPTITTPVVIGAPSAGSTEQVFGCGTHTTGFGFELCRDYGITGIELEILVKELGPGGGLTEQTIRRYRTAVFASQFAPLADAVYERRRQSVDTTGDGIPDWTLDTTLSRREFGTGFGAATYLRRSGTTNRISDVAIVFEGTTWWSWPDWVSNAFGTAIMDTQFLDAVQYVDSVFQKYPVASGTRVTFIGHSLGGRLAQIFAARSHAHGMTFNAAAPARLVLDPSWSSRNVTNVFMLADIVDEVSEVFFLANDTGQEVRFAFAFPGMVSAHSIEEMVRHLDGAARFYFKFIDPRVVQTCRESPRSIPDDLCSTPGILSPIKAASAPLTPPPAGAPSPPVTNPPVIGAPSVGSTPPTIGSPTASPPPSPPPAGGSVPALLAELGSLTGNSRYAAFSDALANARVPARLSPQQAVDVGRGMNEYHEPYIRLIAERIVGPLSVAQVDRLAAESQGLARFKIVSYLAGLLPGPLHPADIAVIARNMELYRAPTISMLAPRFAPNMGAREVISLFGSMSRPIRLATLSELKSAGRLKYPMSEEEVNAIAVTFGFLLEGTAREVLQQP